MEDEVDRLIQAWQRERPDLDVAPMAVLSRVTRLARHLDRARRQAFEAHGLETWEFDVLASRGLVERLPDPADRRGVLVQLTGAGRDAVDAAMADLLAHERALLGSLSEADQRRITRILRELVRPFDNA